MTHNAGVASLSVTCPEGRQRHRPTGASAEEMLNAALSTLVSDLPWYAVRREFWTPLSHERADLALISPTEMIGIEIKAATDRLTRLPRQMAAYDRVFTYCYAIVDERHADAALHATPDHWSVLTGTKTGDCVELLELRPAQRNDNYDPESLVRLLWKDEAAEVLNQLGRPVNASSARSDMWDTLLNTLEPSTLAEVVADTLYSRNPATTSFSQRAAARRAHA